MKKMMLFLFAVLILVSCGEPGSIKKVSPENGDSNIEVYKYWVSGSDFVYISRFKDEPRVVTTTWEELQGKVTVTRANIVIFENDSIIVYKKQKND